MSLLNFSEKRLLIITSTYPNHDNTFIGEVFVKNQVESLKKYFKEIIVIAPVLFSFKLRQYDKLCEDYAYDNVKVYYPRCFYIPIFYFNKILIDNRFQVIKSVIENENIKFDLIHAHFTWPSAYVAAKLKEIYHKPVVVTIHENSGWFQKEVEMNYPLINFAWENADALIRVNKKDIPVLKKYNKNVFSIPNGFSSSIQPLQQNKCRKVLKLPEKKKIIFSLGWLIERKGFNYLVDAMREIVDRRKDVLCVIGGSGPEKNKLQRQIARLKLTDYVKLVGQIKPENVGLWMNACDIFVLPSLGEGNPTVMFEALGVGLPFIGTNVGGVSEIIGSEEYGLVCSPANIKELTDKIMAALDKKWDREKIKEYGSQFTWDNVAKQIVEIYKNLYTGHKDDYQNRKI